MTAADIALASPDADTGRTLTLARRIPAPVARVWAAWTDPDRLPGWWGPRGFTCRTREIDIREGGLWRFDMIAPDGTVFVNRHRFVRIVPQTAIDYRLDDDGTGDHAFDAEVRFAPDGAGTRLSLRMIFATADERAQVERVGAVALGYTTLDCLAEAAMPGHALSLTRLLAAPRARVWRAWTRPADLARWFVPDGFDVARTDFAPAAGASWRTVLRPLDGGPDIAVRGRFERVDAPGTLVFTHGWEDAAGAVPVNTRCTLDLAEIAGGTRLTLVQEGLPDAASRDGHAEGWGQTVDSLARFLDMQA